MQNAKRHFKKIGKPALAALLVGLILLLNAMAACPALHELIHKDADHADHQCAVTMFAHGKVDSVTCEVPIVAPTVWVEIVPLSKFSVFSSAIQNLPHGRAPPAVVSSPA
jgi:hypothetical protein